EKNDYTNLLKMTFFTSMAQLGALSFALNMGFMWIFGSVVEKKLISWRYPLFLLIGMVGCWALLAYEAISPSQKYIGPTMMFMYILGGYLVFKPKKPFKPQEWKPLPWKVFKDDTKVKVPWVSPWVYISIFGAYTAMVYFMASMGRQELVELTHLGFVGNIRQMFMGTLPGGAYAIMRPVPAVETMLLGVFVSYILVNIVFKSKMRRQAGDLQVQAVLQYKELRALDMNHKQAVEGTAKLLSVPLDVVKDWIAVGLQPQKDDQN
ncbi:MAG: hypothetical protein K2X81_27145, partial [Candidatus Obscuribacterales bacterium]|nr:hypothetical protein [Candidatus Obscuribacterales bacterium]